MSLALGNEGTTLWQGRASTRTPFTLTEVRCGDAVFPLIGGASTPKDLALGCGNRGETPQLAFSAPVQDLTLTALRKLVRLEPSVPDLRFQVYGTRVQLRRQVRPRHALQDDARPARRSTTTRSVALREVKSAEVYFHLGWKTPFLAWQQSTAMLELKGPRTVPLRGYGEPRADVRVLPHRPAPQRPVALPRGAGGGRRAVGAALPRRGAGEPGARGRRQSRRSTCACSARRWCRAWSTCRWPTSRAPRPSASTSKPLLDDVVGAGKPGTYLVGLRRLTGKPERA